MTQGWGWLLVVGVVFAALVWMWASVLAEGLSDERQGPTDGR